MNPTALSSQRPTPSPRPMPSANTQVKVLDSVAGRILCLADVRGKISTINDLVQETGAKAVIHTGDFGFFENSSLDRINDRTLRHLVLYSPLIPQHLRQSRFGMDVTPASIRHTLVTHPNPLLSEFPLLVSGALRLTVPVYTVWGACEDVQILEKFRAGEYDIDNLTVLDEATTRCIDVGGVKLRLFGLGGALVMHKMFDNGEGRATLAGGQGTMWTTALQIGELVDTAQRIFDPTETRLLVTHASPGREGLLSQLALVLKADLAISAGLHFRYSSSYNEFSVQSDMEAFRTKLLSGQTAFNKVWESVKAQVESAVDENQRLLLEKALSVVGRVPAPSTAPGPGGAAAGEEPAWKNCWNWNLCDAAYGQLVLDIKDGRVSAELKSQGFNYSYRRSAAPPVASIPTSTIVSPAPPPVNIGLSPAPTPSAAQQKPPIPKQHQPPTPAPSTNAGPTGTAMLPIHAVKAPQNQNRPMNGAPVQGPGKKGGKDKQKEEREKDKDGEKSKESSSSPVPAPVSKEKSNAKPATPKPATPKPSVDSTAKPEGQEAGTSAAAAASPTPDAVSPPPGKESASGGSAGGRTPTTKRPPRNPWTLFMNKISDLPVTDAEIREFFGEAKGGITFVKIPMNHQHRTQKGFAYVEFGDEEAMKAGLTKHAEKLKNCTPRVVVAEQREQPESGESQHQNMRGGPFRGAGRGGRGGYARNSVAAAAAAAAGPSGRPAGRKPENGSAGGGQGEGEGEVGPQKEATPAAAAAPAPAAEGVSTSEW